jgi:hypothetical protein
MMERTAVNLYIISKMSKLYIIHFFDSMCIHCIFYTVVEQKSFSKSVIDFELISNNLIVKKSAFK